MMKTHEMMLHNHSSINLSAYCFHSFCVALSITSYSLAPSRPLLHDVFADEQFKNYISWPITGLDRPLGLQELEVPRICRH